MPVAIGVAFTTWELDRLALLAGALALAGGAVALWAFHPRGQYSIWPVAVWIVLFATFAMLVWGIG